MCLQTSKGSIHTASLTLTPQSQTYKTRRYQDIIQDFPFFRILDMTLHWHTKSSNHDSTINALKFYRTICQAITASANGLISYIELWIN